MVIWKCLVVLWTMANGLSDQLKVKQAKGLTTPILQQQRLKSVVFVMGFASLA